MLKLALATLLGLFLAASAAVAQTSQFEKGIEAAHRGEYELAIELWRPLAEEGDLKAQTYMGLMYDNGWGVPQDYAEAHRWFLRAAEKGYAKAQYHLAFSFHQGRGVQRSQTEALKWYNRAAAQGESAAQYNLGKIYAHGLVVRRDLVEAYKWLALAARGSSPISPLAARDRDLLEPRLTPEQLELAEQRVEDWRPS